MQSLILPMKIAASKPVLFSNFVSLKECYSMSIKALVIYLIFIRIENGIPPFVELLEFFDGKVQRAAAAALRTLAFKNDENKSGIMIPLQSL